MPDMKNGREEMMDKNLTNSELPLGLGMAFAQNIAAMEKFSTMSKIQQEEVIRRAQNIGSKAEMAETPPPKMKQPALNYVRDMTLRPRPARKENILKTAGPRAVTIITAAPATGKVF